MKAIELYKKLDKDFDIVNLKDDWSFMKFNEYIAPSFKEYYMGIVLDNTPEVKKVYTAVFPDSKILERLIQTEQIDILLFAHHAMGYNPNLKGFPFYDNQRIKSWKKSFTPHSLVDIAHSYDYYDQMHLTKDFKKYASSTPGVFLNKNDSVKKRWLLLWKKGEEDEQNSSIY